MIHHAMNKPPATPRGRRPGAHDTRSDIVAAARRAFAARGLDGTSIRAVAREAGVDPALVHHYFESKQALFVAAMELPFRPADIAAQVLAGDPRTVGRRLVLAVLGLMEDDDARQVVLSVLRSAIDDPAAAAVLRTSLLRDAVGPVAQAVGRPPAELRATLVGSQLAGLLIHRYVLQLEPLASTDPHVVAAAVGPALQHYLTGDLDVPSEQP
jgi:AcrR family transcriptional regulator